MSAFRYPATGALHWGAGGVDRLGEILAGLGLDRCLAVLTPALAGDATRFERASGGRIAGTFAGVEPHTPYDAVLAAAAAARAIGATAVVSVGGGSAIDTARIAALCVGANAMTADELHALRAHDGLLPALQAPALPHVAVPTTLSAAEHSGGGAATSPATRRKELFVGDALACRAVVLDPRLATATPVDVWTMTGMRAVDHAVETLLSPSATPISDEASTAAIRILRRALPAALAAPDDEQVRADGQLAACLSYLGVANGTLGLSHAIGHQLGGALGVAHGAASSIALPDVVRYLAPRVPDRARLVAGALEADDAADGLEQLVGALGLPRRLGTVGISVLDPETLADAVLEDVLAAGTPGGVPERDELVALLAGLA